MNIPSVSTMKNYDHSDPGIQYDVDTMTLDYLCYRAIQAILRTRRTELDGKSSDVDVEIHLSIFSSQLTSPTPQKPFTVTLFFSIHYKEIYTKDWVIGSSI